MFVFLTPLVDVLQRGAQFLPGDPLLDLRLPSPVFSRFSCLTEMDHFRPLGRDF